MGARNSQRELGIIHAYHDRSDGGGLVTTIVEMAFTGMVGVGIKLKGYAASIYPQDILASLFNKEPGAVFQVSESNFKAFEDVFR